MGAMSFTIHAAAPTDEDGLAVVFKDASLFNEQDRAHLLADPESLVLGEDAVREDRTRVAVDALGSIVGFASWSIANGVADLQDLFVRPEWMRRGVGRALVLDISERARARGCATLEVTANPGAAAFYEHVGFALVRLVETEFQPALRMRRSI